MTESNQESFVTSSGGSTYEELEMIVCPCDGKEHLRNSEGSVIALADEGSLLLAYTRFRGGSSSDFAPADIATRISSDGGRTWSDDTIVAHGHDETGHVLSASLLRLGSGAIALFYGRTTYTKGPDYYKGNMDDVSLYCIRQIMRVSHDEGKTWSDERDITMPGEHCQFLLNDCAVRLSTGRIILPNYHGLSPYTNSPCFVQPLLSDDDGETWRRSQFRLAGKSPQGAQSSESSVVECADGSLLMVSRTKVGFLYHCRSTDGGETWTEPKPTELAASATPTSLRRIPGSDDLVLIWNQANREESRWGFARHRLTTAISSDDGNTWKHRRNLESLNDVTYIPPEDAGPIEVPDRFEQQRMREQKRIEFGMKEDGIVWAEYTSMIFVDDWAVITYDVVEEGVPGCSLKLRILPKEWFYEGDDHTKEAKAD